LMGEKPNTPLAVVNASCLFKEDFFIILRY
jgi:hypothetical protein